MELVTMLGESRREGASDEKGHNNERDIAIDEEADFDKSES